MDSAARCQGRQSGYPEWSAGFGSVDNYLSVLRRTKLGNQSRALKLSVGRIAFQASTLAATLPFGRRQSAST